MKFYKKALSFLLVFTLLFALVSCAEEKKETLTETKTEEKTAQSEAEKKKMDEEYLKKYLASYRAGEFDEKKKFQIEDLSVYFELGAYKGITYPDDPMISGEVTDEDVEAYLTQIFLAAAVSDDKYTELTQGEVQRFDMITLDYRGIMGGKEVENATAKDQSLLIGSGNFILGFEDGLLGKKIGEEIKLDLTFSPYYGDKEVAGKDITFFVTVKKIQRPALPEFDVKVINENYSTDFKTIEEARAFFKSALGEKEKNDAYSALSAYLQNKILSASTVKSYPEKEMESYRNHYIGYWNQYRDEEESWEDFCAEQMGISYDEFKAQTEEYAKESVATSLMIRSLAKKENITYTDEQLSALIYGIYESDGEVYGSLESMVVDYTNIYGADYFEHQLITASVMEFLHENAVKEAV